jgi:flagellar biosynthesis protein FliQ
MNPDYVVDIVRQTLYTALQISAPMLLIAMVIGFTISIFQSVTQINEMTLTFVPKILVFGMTLSIFFPWILKTTMAFAVDILTTHWNKVTEFTNYAR